MKRRLKKSNFVSTQRYFETGKAEEGISILSEFEIKCCQMLAIRILKRTGISFPRESAFYDIIDSLVRKQDESSFCEFTNWDKSFFYLYFKQNSRKVKTQSESLKDIGRYMQAILDWVKILSGEISNEDICMQSMKK